MRAWGLAKGLNANGLDVTVAVNNSFTQELSEHEGVRLINWGLDEQFASLINTYDAVIISYCMGDPSVFVVDNINDDVQLVLDAYVPIYVEVSARESKDIDTEYKNYMGDIARFNKVLMRGDYFLCANEAQKTFYVGVLASLGIVNPRSYRDERILVVPFGIHNIPAKAKVDPYQNLGIAKKDFVVLWFGGLYPWFHVEELLDAMLILSANKNIKFVFVGGKNPFNPNPDFFQQYEKAVNFAEEHDLNNRSVFFVDWVDFDERINWYQNAGLVISLNQPGEENKYSWRTRVMDYVWGELAILTNGGDPLSEDLINAGAALRLPKLSASSIVDTIGNIYKNQTKLSTIRQSVKNLKPIYYWDNVTKPLQAVILSAQFPYADEISYRQKLGGNVSPWQEESPKTSQNKIIKAASLAPKLISKVRKKGVLKSAKLATGIAKTQIKKRGSLKAPKRYVFISHPIDNTGAPLVLLQIIKEFAKEYGGRNILLVTPDIQTDQLQVLHKLGVRVEKAVFGLGFRFIRLQLGLRPNDFVLMNTVAIYDSYRDFILLWLRNGRLKHAYWFIHEDKAQLPIIHKEFLHKPNIKRVHSLSKKNKLTILVPSERTKQEYDKILNTKTIQTIKPVSLHVEVSDKYTKKRKADDYSSIDFLLSGTAADGRKGQLLALSAFYSFIKEYYDKNPNTYRKFKLRLVAIGKDDYISQQIRWIGESLIKKYLVIYPSLPKEKALGITAKCNSVICCSLNETFGLYVAEGMFMGHVVLRNNSAGVDEQLKDGVNGYFIDHTNIKQFASVIEKILNKKTTPDKKLQAMGRASQEIISEYNDNSYISQIPS